MTSENFWLCVAALAAELDGDLSVDAVERELRALRPAQRDERRRQLTVIVSQSRVEIRMMSDILVQSRR
jgi:hypothetical protein